eukprot:4519083-Alexandrium_andersonii.AAC.1
MSASLVGSEMCIRASATRALADTNLPEVRTRGSGALQLGTPEETGSSPTRQSETRKQSDPARKQSHPAIRVERDTSELE